jgi:hypothetical protein
MIVAEDDGGWVECECERCEDHYVVIAAYANVQYCDGCLAFWKNPPSVTVKWSEEGF